jgi:hypothetical protein
MSDHKDDVVMYLKKCSEVITPDGPGNFVGYVQTNRLTRQLRVKLKDGRIRQYKFSDITIPGV